MPTITTRGGDATNEGIAASGGRSISVVKGPGNHLHFRPGVGLTGVEASVRGETRIDSNRHQPGFSEYEQVTEVGGDGLNRAVSQPTAQPAFPLGEQHRPIGRKGKVPRVSAEVGDERRDRDPRCRLPTGNGGMPNNQQERNNNEQYVFVHSLFKGAGPS